MSMSKADKEFNNKKLEQYNSDDKIEDKNKFAKEIVNHYEKNYSNLRTITIKVSQTKKFFRLQTDDKELYLHINPDKELTKKVRLMNTTALKNNRTHTIITKKWVDDLINKYRNSNVISELYVYININTGLRIMEIIKGTFANKCHTKGTIHFTGLLKKRKGDPGQVCIKTIDKKLKVLKNIKKFKNKIKDKKPLSLQRCIQNNVRKLTQPFGFKTHLLRSLYANYMFEFRNPEKKYIMPLLLMYFTIRIYNRV